MDALPDIMDTLPDLMDTLPDHIILKIFSYFTKSPEDLLAVRQVCSRWKEIAEFESLWENVEVSLNWWCRHVALQCLRVAPVLGTLYVNCSTLPDRMMSKIEEHRPRKIKRLLFFSLRTPKELNIFSEILNLFAHQLEELNVPSGGLDLPFPKIEHLPNLKKLSVPNCVSLDISAQSLPQLREIEINCEDFDDWDNISTLLLELKSQLKRIFARTYGISIFGPLRLCFDRTLKIGFPALEEIEFDVMTNDFGTCSLVEDERHRLVDCEFCQFLLFLCSASVLECNSNLNAIRLQMMDFYDCECLLRKSAGAKKFNELTIIENSCCCSVSGTESLRSVALRMISRIVHSFDVQMVFLKGCGNFFANVRDSFSKAFPRINFQFSMIVEQYHS